MRQDSFGKKLNVIFTKSLLASLIFSLFLPAAYLPQALAKDERENSQRPSELGIPSEFLPGNPDLSTSVPELPDQDLGLGSTSVNRYLQASDDGEERVNPAQSEFTPDSAAAEATEAEQIFNHLNGEAETAPRRLFDYGLLDQDLLKFEKPGRIRADDIVVEASSTDDAPVKGLPDALYARHQVSAFKNQSSLSIADLTLRGADSIKLSYQGQAFLHYKKAVKQAAFYGNYLVLNEETSYDPATRLYTLKFIDLEHFEMALGRTELPVFQVPLADISANANLEMRDGKLFLGSCALPMQIFETYGDIQDTAFDLEVNMLEPTTYAGATTAVNEIDQAFKRAIEITVSNHEDSFDDLFSQTEVRKKFLSDLGNQLRDQRDKLSPDTKAAADKIQGPPTSQAELAAKNEASIAKAGQSIANTLVAQKRLLARVGHLFRRFTLPQPLGAPTVKGAFISVAAGLFLKNKLSLRADLLKEGALQLINSKWGKFGTTFAVAGVYALFAPASFSHFAYSALQLGSDCLEHVAIKMTNVGTLIREATATTAKGFWPRYLHEAYISDGRWSHFLIGTAALAGSLIMTLGVPHLLVNVYNLSKDLISNREEWEGIGLKAAIIQRENKLRLTTLNQILQGTLRDEGPVVERHFTDEETARVRDVIAQLNEKNKNWISTCTQSVTKWLPFGFLGRAANFVFADKEVTTFVGALRYITIGFGSIAASQVAFAKFWNRVWFRFRAFATRPILGGTFVLFPEYYGVATNPRNGTTIIPDRLNGGARPFYSTIAMKAARFLGSKDWYRATKKWEDKVLDVQGEIYKRAFTASFPAMLRHVESLEEWQTLVGGGGINSVSDSTMYDINPKARGFFQAYFQKIAGEATNLYLQDLAAQSSACPESDFGDMSNFDLKRATLQCADQMSITPEAAKNYVAAAVANPENEKWARESSGAWYRVFLNAFGLTPTSRNFSNSYALSPDNNGQVERMNLVEEKLKNPVAVARAARAALSELLVDRPIEAMLVIATVAAVKTGIFKPMSNEMFDQNHLFYMSRAVFWGGYFMGTLYGVLPATWMKVQQDAQHNEQTFAEVPEGDQAKGGFMSYFWKRFYHPDNTLTKSWGTMNMIVWKNLRPAFFTYLACYWPTMGRIDLDNLILGYMISFGTPLSAFGQKLEQAFELSIGHVAAQYPAELRTHPEALADMNARIQRLRIRFDFVDKIIREEGIGNIVNTLTAISYAGDTRAMARQIFAGATPTEIFATGAETTKHVLNHIPLVGRPTAKIVSFCEKILTHKYVDWRPLFKYVPNGESGPTPGE